MSERFTRVCTHLSIIIFIFQVCGDESNGFNRLVRLWGEVEACFRGGVGVALGSVGRRLSVHFTVWMMDLRQLEQVGTCVDGKLSDLAILLLVGVIVARVGLLGPALVVVGSFHKQYSRKVIEKEHAHPLGHAVSPGCSEVPVDDNDGDENREDIHDEGEEKVFGNERDGDGSWREDLRHQQEKHD